MGRLLALGRPFVRLVSSETLRAPR
jgi:hypothetical protein